MTTAFGLTDFSQIRLIFHKGPPVWGNAGEKWANSRNRKVGMGLVPRICHNNIIMIWIILKGNNY